MTLHKGTCHCGGVGVAYETAVPPADTPVRACQCSFCRMHGALAVSDPKGSLEFTENRAGALRCYRFALGTADFILCGICGAYLGAILNDEAGGGYGIVNIRVLDEPDAFIRAPEPSVYDAENESERIARRCQNWTPVTRTVGSA